VKILLVILEAEVFVGKLMVQVKHCYWNRRETKSRIWLGGRMNEEADDGVFCSLIQYLHKSARITLKVYPEAISPSSGF
jgi:hypothetical protein